MLSGGGPKKVSQGEQDSRTGFFIKEKKKVLRKPPKGTGVEADLGSKREGASAAHPRKTKNPGKGQGLKRKVRRKKKQFRCKEKGGNLLPQAVVDTCRPEGKKGGKVRQSPAAENELISGGLGS